MKLVDGKIVYEMRQCYICDGKGQHKNMKPCTRNNLPQRGKPCPHCGTTTKQHQFVDNGMIACGVCNATGQLLEDRFSYIPANILLTLPIRLVKVNREPNFNERNLGYGSMISVVDYLDHTTMSDEQNKEYVLDIITRHKFQACDVVDVHDKLCTEIVMVCTEGGYTLKGEQ